MRRVATVGVAALVCALVLAGGSAAHYPSIAYRSPALGPDGGLYLAGGAGYVYSLEGDGSVVWSHGIEGEAIDRPTVHRGAVVVPTVDGRVVAADADTGERIWDADVGDRPGRYGATATAGTVYVAGPAGVAALGVADGATQWTTALDGPAVAGPVAVGDRVVVGVGRGEAARLVALDAAGDVAWRVPLDDHVRALAAAGGHVLVASGGAVRALDGGDRLWRVRTGEVSGLSPAAGGAVVGTYDGAVVRIRDGAVAWRASVDALAVAPAPGPADGTSETANGASEAAGGGSEAADGTSEAADGWVYAVTPDAVVGVRDGAVRWRTRVGLTVVAPPAIGERVYVGTQVNRTYALDRTGDVAWVDRFATPVGSAPGADHGAAPPAFIDDAVGPTTRVVYPNGTTERPGGSPGLSGVDPLDVAALVAVVALAAGLLAVGRRWG